MLLPTNALGSAGPPDGERFEVAGTGGSDVAVAGALASSAGDELPGRTAVAPAGAHESATSEQARTRIVMRRLISSSVYLRPPVPPAA